MNKKSSARNRRSGGRWVFALPVMLLLGLLFLVFGEAVTAAPGDTPLQSSGLTPIWQENFTGGSIDRLQYAWVSGSTAASTSCVVPGAVYLGSNSVVTTTEVPIQQMNNFKSGSEALPNTIEFDVYSPMAGIEPISLRPRRVGDKVSILLRVNADGKTQVSYNEDNATFTYTVASGGWDHVVVSYQQEATGDPATTAHYVIAINDEVREHTHTTGITPTWASTYGSSANADGWSFQSATNPGITVGRYIANVRAYNGFLTKTDLEGRLSGVNAYLTGLGGAPASCSGSMKDFQRTPAPAPEISYPLGYAKQGTPLSALTVDFDGSFSSAYDKITSYAWTFGDSGSGSGRFTTHVYGAPGTYTIGLTVISTDGTAGYTFPFTVEGASLGPIKAFLPFIRRQ